MAISTYSELQTAIANWLARDDLTTRIPEFIALAEADMNRRLRTQQMQASSTVTFSSSSATAAFPANCLEVKRLYIDSSPKVALTYISPFDAIEQYAGVDNGQPRFYTIEDELIRLVPPPDGTYTVQVLGYYAPSALSTGAPTNYILSSHPDAYLFGALLEAWSYVGNDAEAQKVAARFEAALAKIESADKRASVSGPLSTKAQRVV